MDLLVLSVFVLVYIGMILGEIPGLALAGNAYRGAGIPDCIRSGEAAAESLLNQRASA